jgi:hypothetical protein
LRTSTSVKLAIAGVIALLFAGIVLRAAARLVSVAMHSLFTAVLLLVIVVWATRKIRS